MHHPKPVTKMLTSAKTQAQIQNMENVLVPPCPILLITINTTTLNASYKVNMLWPKNVFPET